MKKLVAHIFTHNQNIVGIFNLTLKNNMIVIKHSKTVKTWCFDINLMIKCIGVQYWRVYQRHVTFTPCEGLTQHY